MYTLYLAIPGQLLFGDFFVLIMVPSALPSDILISFDDSIVLLGDDQVAYVHTLRNSRARPSGTVCSWVNSIFYWRVTIITFDFESTSLRFSPVVWRILLFISLCRKEKYINYVSEKIYSGEESQLPTAVKMCCLLRTRPTQLKR